MAEKPEILHSGADSETLLEVENLSIGFRQGRDVVEITDKVGFRLEKGRMLGLVGESGCGKTLTCLSLLRLLPSNAVIAPDAAVRFEGRNLLALSAEDLRQIRGARIAMIFQEPSAALNPLLTIGAQLREPFRFHPGHSGDPGRRIRELLERVGIADPDRILKAYPHELSGGMLQRVMIAMALSLHPDLILADEPTTALDVTVQAQIMELLASLQKDFGAAVLLVTHNLNLIAQYADRVAVMYAGRLVEEASVEDFLAGPAHPYSRGLLAALPRLVGPGAADDLEPIPGQVPKPADFEIGCRFRERCPLALEACRERPEEVWLRPDHRVACLRAGEMT